MISTNETTIISSSSENPWCLLDAIRFFPNGGKLRCASRPERFSNAALDEWRRYICRYPPPRRAHPARPGEATPQSHRREGVGWRQSTRVQRQLIGLL